MFFDCTSLPMLLSHLQPCVVFRVVLYYFSEFLVTFQPVSVGGSIQSVYKCLNQKSMKGKFWRGLLKGIILHQRPVECGDWGEVGLLIKTETSKHLHLNAKWSLKCQLLTLVNFCRLSVEIYSTVFMCSKDNIYVLSDCLNIHIRFKMEIQLHEWLISCIGRVF